MLLGGDNWDAKNSAGVYPEDETLPKAATSSLGRRMSTCRRPPHPPFPSRLPAGSPPPCSVVEENREPGLNVLMSGAYWTVSRHIFPGKNSLNSFVESGRALCNTHALGATIAGAL
jgi:hypothetical protein